MQAQQLVSTVRQSILNGAEGPDCDPWDEEEGGAGWLENEIGFFDQFWTGNTRDDFCYPFKTVEEWVEYLSKKPESYLETCLKFIQKGGTNMENVFDLRDNNEIGEFFYRLNT